MATKADLIARLSAATGLPKKKVNEVLDVLVDLTYNDIDDHGVAVLPGIGKLKVRSRNERRGRNPKTGESLTIPARAVVKFSATRGLKAFVATGFAPANVDVE